MGTGTTKTREGQQPLQGEKLEQVSRKAKTLYYIEMDNQKRLKRDKKLSQLKGKSAQEKSKMIHSMTKGWEPIV
jgi:hypothetical protein